MCEWTCLSVGACGVQKRASDPLELELNVGVTEPPAMGAGNFLEFPERAVQALNCWAISPSLPHFFFFSLCFFCRYLFLKKWFCALDSSEIVLLEKNKTEQEKHIWDLKWGAGHVFATKPKELNLGPGKERDDSQELSCDRSPPPTLTRSKHRSGFSINRPSTWSSRSTRDIEMGFQLSVTSSPSGSLPF